MAKINVLPAARDLTEHGRVFNRAAERIAIARGLVRYQRQGGLVAHYAKGSTWDRPYSVTTRVGRKTVHGDVAVYVDSIKARLAVKAAAKRRQHDERLERAKGFMVNQESDFHYVTDDSVA